jgi:hypothetical protein
MIVSLWLAWGGLILIGGGYQSASKKPSKNTWFIK